MRLKAHVTDETCVAPEMSARRRMELDPLLSVPELDSLDIEIDRQSAPFDQGRGGAQHFDITRQDILLETPVRTGQGSEPVKKSSFLKSTEFVQSLYGSEPSVYPLFREVPGDPGFREIHGDARGGDPSR